MKQRFFKDINFYGSVDRSQHTAPVAMKKRLCPQLLAGNLLRFNK
jgi:hypothetical protein